MVKVDKMVIMSVMAWLYIVMNRTNIGVYLRSRENVGQNNINSEIIAIFFVFWPNFGLKKVPLEEALPIGHLYIFGNSGT